MKIQLLDKTHLHFPSCAAESEFAARVTRLVF